MASDRRIDTASRVIAAPPEAVYGAFTDPDAWVEWLPPADMTGSIQQFDFQEGGAFRLTLTYTSESAAGKTTSTEDVSKGIFLEITPNHRLVQHIVFESDDPSFAGTMLMTWSLENVDGGTLVTITAEDVPPGISAEDHAIGLQSTLKNLDRYTSM